MNKDTMQYQRLLEEGYEPNVVEINLEFDRWLAQRNAEVAEAERERIIKLLIDENFFCNGHWDHECPDDKNCKLTINGGWHGKSPCELDFMGGSDCKRAIALIKGENE